MFAFEIAEQLGETGFKLLAGFRIGERGADRVERHRLELGVGDVGASDRSHALPVDVGVENPFVVRAQADGGRRVGDSPETDVGPGRQSPEDGG